mgnify:CR=1 FL=1
MPSVVITAFASRSDAIALADEVLGELGVVGIDAEFHVLDGVAPIGLTPESLIVSLGGDGTFLRSARLAHDADCRVLGVELGRVGFLLDVPPSEITQQVKLALANPQFESRLALAITLPGASDAGFALNEVLVGSSEPGRMVRVRTFVDSDLYLTYNADGVMVATPTGSTGHNFSAGGPVVDAGIPVMLLTPVAPHFTIDRTIVVSDGRVIRLEAVERGAMVFADGQPIGSLDAGESVVISKSSRPVKVVATRQSELVNRLRKGLREGHA